MQSLRAFYLLQAFFLLMFIGKVNAKDAPFNPFPKNATCILSVEPWDNRLIVQDTIATEIMVSDSRKALNRSIWTFSTSDIFFRKALTPFDVTRQDYVETIRLLHPYAVAFSEGKTSDWARQVVGDTIEIGRAHV